MWTAACPPASRCRIASPKICLCPVHKTTYHRSVFQLCTKITSSIMLLGITNESCCHVFTEADFSWGNQWHFCRFGRTVQLQTISWEAKVGERVSLQSRRALFGSSPRNTVRHRLPRNVCCWMPLPRPRAIIFAMGCGCSNIATLVEISE